MSNITLQNSLPLINTTNFINDFLDTLLEEYCSQHYKENTVIGEGIKLPTLVTLLRYKYPNYKLISPGVLGHIYTTEVKVIYKDKYHDQLVNALNHKLSIFFTQYTPKNISTISFSTYSNHLESRIVSRLSSPYIHYKQLTTINLVRKYVKQYNVTIENHDHLKDLYLCLYTLLPVTVIYKPTVEILKEINNQFLKSNEEVFNNFNFTSFNFESWMISLYITLSSEEQLEDIKNNISLDYFNNLSIKCSEYLIQFKSEFSDYLDKYFKLKRETVKEIEEPLNLLNELNKQSKVIVETIIEEPVKDQSNLDLTSEELFYLKIILSILVLGCFYFIFK